MSTEKNLVDKIDALTHTNVELLRELSHLRDQVPVEVQKAEEKTDFREREIEALKSQIRVWQERYDAKRRYVLILEKQVAGYQKILAAIF